MACDFGSLDHGHRLGYYYFHCADDSRIGCPLDPWNLCRASGG